MISVELRRFGDIEFVAVSALIHKMTRYRQDAERVQLTDKDLGEPWAPLSA